MRMGYLGLTLCTLLCWQAQSLAATAKKAMPIELEIGEFDKAKTPLKLLTKSKLQSDEHIELGAPAIAVNKGWVLPRGMYKYVAEKVKGHGLPVAEAGRGSRKLLICDDDSSGAVNAADTFKLKDNYVFAPLAETIAFKRKLLKVDSLEEGMLRLLEVPGEGKLSLSYKGRDSTEIEAAVVASDGSVSWLTEGKGSLQPLTAGEYTFAYGLVYSKKLKKYVAGVVQGKMEPFEVVKDKTCRKKLGKDFVIAYEPVIKGEKLTISSRMKLYGAGGEEYVSFKWLTRPEVYYKKSKLGAFGFG